MTPDDLRLLASYADAFRKWAAEDGQEHASEFRFFAEQMEAGISNELLGRPFDDGALRVHEGEG